MQEFTTQEDSLTEEARDNIGGHNSNVLEDDSPTEPSCKSDLSASPESPITKSQSSFGAKKSAGSPPSETETWGADEGTKHVISWSLAATQVQMVVTPHMQPLMGLITFSERGCGGRCSREGDRDKRKRWLLLWSKRWNDERKGGYHENKRDTITIRRYCACALDVRFWNLSEPAAVITLAHGPAFLLKFQQRSLKVTAGRNAVAFDTALATVSEVGWKEGYARVSALWKRSHKHGGSIYNTFHTHQAYFLPSISIVMAF